MSSCVTEAAKAEDVLHRRKNLYKAKHNNSSQEDRRKIFLADQKKYVCKVYANICPVRFNLPLCFQAHILHASIMCANMIDPTLLEREMMHLMQPEDFLKLKNSRMMLKKWKLSHTRYLIIVHIPSLNRNDFGTLNMNTLIFVKILTKIIKMLGTNGQKALCRQTNDVRVDGGSAVGFGRKVALCSMPNWKEVPPNY
jgi:hypothetical protein